ncbi:MAG TPA: hypothetical protein VLC46_00685 [Thermoanaerobaculia bacterium]|jgi:hypothetical protein|nr:hypothetical protein [Thermoanaerobaculia bacterium]
MRDYFAELFVAGRFAEAGWNVYFPHRDKGFDFVVAKDVGSGHQLFRPVQVKGKYPKEGKTNKPTYGYVGKLTQLHPEMVLAIPFFPIESQKVPSCVAYLPFSLIRRHATKGYRCQPATFKSGVPSPRRDHRRFFDQEGLVLLERKHWSTIGIGTESLLPDHDGVMPMEDT